MTPVPKARATEPGGATWLMTQGGDARILLDPATGLNPYHSAPAPSDVLAYASSTANDISAPAFAHVEARLADIGTDPDARIYARALEQMRDRIRAAYGLSDDTGIVFSPSGTDLEYVALACVAGGATHNILLGADEVGSGCIFSAHGLYFADRTAIGIATTKGDPVPGLGGTRVGLIDVPVRDEAGYARPSAVVAALMDEAVRSDAAAGRHSLLHLVHGSKTGVILPSLGDVDALLDRYRGRTTLVVDACQARITSRAVRDYLDRGAIVFVTGSKFMGGPPFSGFALVPPLLQRAAPLMPLGLATIFRRGEWPADWPGADILPEGANVGLLLRLEAAIFELERFQRLSLAEVERVILAFHGAVRSEIVDGTPARRVAPYPRGDREEADTHPIEMRTLSTLDLMAFDPEGATLEQAVDWHKALLGHGVRLGQPVKCVRNARGKWGATLRIGLSMPQAVERAALADEDLQAAFRADMARIRDALLSVSAASASRSRERL